MLPGFFPQAALPPSARPATDPAGPSAGDTGANAARSDAKAFDNALASACTEASAKTDTKKGAPSTAGAAGQAASAPQGRQAVPAKPDASRADAPANAAVDATAVTSLPAWFALGLNAMPDGEPDGETGDPKESDEDEIAAVDAVDVSMLTASALPVAPPPVSLPTPEQTSAAGDATVKAKATEQPDDQGGRASDQSTVVTTIVDASAALPSVDTRDVQRSRTAGSESHEQAEAVTARKREADPADTTSNAAPRPAAPSATVPTPRTQRQRESGAPASDVASAAPETDADPNATARPGLPANGTVSEDRPSVSSGTSVTRNATGYHQYAAPVQPMTASPSAPPTDTATEAAQPRAADVVSIDSAAPSGATAAAAAGDAAASIGARPQQRLPEAASAPSAPIETVATTSRQAGHQSAGDDSPSHSETHRGTRPDAPSVARMTSAFASSLMLMSAPDGTLRLAPAMVASLAHETMTPENQAANVSSMVQTMRVMVKDEVSEATVHLHPEHFGEVRIAVRVDGKTVSAVIQAESAGVREWLQGQESALRSGLSEQGLHLDRLQVQRDGRHERRESQTPPERRRPRARQQGDAQQPRFEVSV